MTYEELRPEVCNGDLVTFYGTGLKSRLIEWWTGGPSHCALAVWMRVSDRDYGRLFILESTEIGGPRLYPYSLAVEHYTKKGGSVYHQHLLPEAGVDGSGLAENMMDLWGCRYPHKYQFMLIAFGWLRWARKHIRRRCEDIDQYSVHCAEAIATAMRLTNPKYIGEKSAVLWSPQDVSELGCYGEREEVTLDVHLQDHQT